MANNTGTIILVIVLIVGAILIFGGDSDNQVEIDGNNDKVQGNEIIRNIPSEVNSGDSFKVTYSGDKEGKWVSIIVDNVSGPCKFPSGEQLKSFLMSTGGKSSKSITVVPLSKGTCTFSGYYRLAGDPVPPPKYFPDMTVNIK